MDIIRWVYEHPEVTLSLRRHDMIEDSLQFVGMRMYKLTDILDENGDKKVIGITQMVDVRVRGLPGPYLDYIYRRLVELEIEEKKKADRQG